MQGVSKLIRVLGILLLFLGACSSQEVELQRRSALSFFQEGNKSYTRHDYTGAIWNYQKAIELDEDTPSFHYNLGLALYQLGDYQQALTAFKTVEAQEPRQADVHYNMALVYHKLYRSDLAEAHYNRYQALSSQPKAPKSAPAPAAAPAATPPPAPSAPQIQRLLPPGLNLPPKDEIPSWE